MSEFTGALVTRHRQGRLYVENSFRYFLGSLQSNLYAKVRRGSLTNLVSTYWFIGWLLPKLGNYDRAGALHDELYTYPYLYSIVDGKEVAHRIDKLTADFLLFDACKADNVKYWRAVLMYVALFLGGFVAWYRCRRLELNNG